MDYIGTIEKDNRLERTDQIIIYGAGKVGRHVLEILKKTGRREQIVCFCDNGKDMEGRTIEEIPIQNVKETCALHPQGTYLVASMFVRQIVESLLQYGIERIHIIRESSTE